MPGKVREYESQDIIVRYDVRRCIHAKECVHSLPEVFDPERRPWVDPSAAAADRVAEAVLRCPTGALTFIRSDGGPAEVPPSQPELREIENGPIYVRGRVHLVDSEGRVVAAKQRMALCRCGASRNKPYCDNSHLESGFKSR